MALDNLYFKCLESGIRIKHEYSDYKKENESKKSKKKAEDKKKKK
jgi:DNA-directed RNA polymerase subunit N (RpoN/RPB10)